MPKASVLRPGPPAPVTKGKVVSHSCKAKFDSLSAVDCDDMGQRCHNRTRVQTLIAHSALNMQEKECLKGLTMFLAISHDWESQTGISA